MELNINGKWVSREVDSSKSLLHFLREDMGLTGTREGCGHGDCGSCTVLLDGKPVLSCIMYAFQAAGRSITTIEGLADGELSVIQECFIEKGAIQCGFCTPAMILVGKALLDENPAESPSIVTLILCSLALLGFGVLGFVTMLMSYNNSVALAKIGTKIIKDRDVSARLIKELKPQLEKKTPIGWNFLPDTVRIIAKAENKSPTE